RDRIADAHGRLFPALDWVADLEAERREDVALLAVLVMDECDAGAAVGVVFDGRHAALDAVLVALEVDLAVELAVTTTLVARRDATLVVPSGMGRDRLDQRLLRLVGGDLLEARDRHETTSRAGRLELAQWHCFYTLPNTPSIFWPGPRVTI